MTGGNSGNTGQIRGVCYQCGQLEILRGTYLIFNTWASVLIDTEASYSFIAYVFASLLGLESEQLESPLVVESPIGGKIVLN